MPLQKASTSPTKAPSNKAQDNSNVPLALSSNNPFHNNNLSFPHSIQQLHQQQKLQQKESFKRQNPENQKIFCEPLKQSSNIQQSIQFSSFQSHPPKPRFQQTAAVPPKPTLHQGNLQKNTSFQPFSLSKQTTLPQKFPNESLPRSQLKQTVYPEAPQKHPASFVNPVYDSKYQPSKTSQTNKQKLHSQQPLHFQYPAPQPIPRKSNAKTLENSDTLQEFTRTNSVEEEMRTAFKYFDIDGNGLIDASELKQTMRALDEMLSDRDVEAMILAVDKNGDGKVDYEGLCRFCS